MMLNDNQYTKLLTLGYNKNKTIVLTAIKDEIIRKKNRFTKNFKPSVKYSQLENLREDLLLSDQEDVLIEMTHSNKPLWMKEYEQIISLMDSIEETFRKQTKQISEQKMKIFSNDINFDAQISQNFEIGTQLLDQTQMRINRLTNYTQTINIENDKIILSNAQQALFLRLKDMRDIFNKQKKTYNDSKKPILSSFSNCESLDQEDEESVQAQEASTANYRSEEINKVTKQMTDLASIFQQMQQLVIEQDSIICNIDSNLESAEKSVQKGRDKLRDAHKIMRSKVGDNIIKILITLIIFFSILLVFRFSK